MSIMTDADRQQVRQLLGTMTQPVKILFFTQTIGCETCGPARQLLDELVPLSDKLGLEEINLVLDADRAREYGVDRVPAIALVGEDHSRIRFYGIPSGYEFMSLLDAIVLVSKGESGLSEASQALVAKVTEPLNIQVFVTPT